MSLYRRPAHDYGGFWGYLVDMKLRSGPSGHNTAAIHGSFRPDDVTKRQSLHGRFVRKDAHGHVLQTEQEINAKRTNNQEPEETN